MYIQTGKDGELIFRTFETYRQFKNSYNGTIRVLKDINETSCEFYFAGKDFTYEYREYEKGGYNWYPVHEIHYSRNLKGYLVPAETPNENNIYTEYAYINGAWEIIGSPFEVDLSDYYTKGEMDDVLNDLELQVSNINHDKIEFGQYVPNTNSPPFMTTV